VVSFLDKNHPACVELTFACSMVGAANAIVNFRLAGDEVDYAVNDAGSRMLLVGTELKPLVEKLRDRLPRVERVVEVTPDGSPGDEYEALLAAASPIDRSPDVTPDDVVLVMYSSGTTGHPKGVMLTQANMLAHTVNAHDGWEFEDGDVNLVAMPLFHVGGSSYVLFGIHDGIPSIMTRDPRRSLAGRGDPGRREPDLPGAGPCWRRCWPRASRAVAVFGKLRTYTYGASPMPMPLLRAAMQAWPETDFIQVYGADRGRRGGHPSDARRTP
jgi:acyl-CoA synthetase (AMP-forming)/AMP-acid ligase II